MKFIFNLIALTFIVVAVNVFDFAKSEFLSEEDNSIERIPANEEDTPTDGAILGSIIAPDAQVVIKGSNGEEKIIGMADSNGEFFINGFDAGIYDIIIKALSKDEIKTYTFKDVEIRTGEVTALGTVTLE
ncbi:carboxypeptidase-like regulatory domain-containing protein [Altibacter sp.]|uniref:carboxypeptidase-like regulatory domain-containing protein n=1 Tax=Altibacter sp. TaxID=2024823 RepID=UPI00258866C0|nr:carboxypeptidase-like regulatory domain-containing protein [Altibacter sp.]MCW8980067.1 carboxypeptidase-like regulatory domain-containing protein [Altibacter sp.]MCW9037211.1 carboxypeptidase-like regulatory domain-containing protein [Altibacter sp.]